MKILLLSLSVFMTLLVINASQLWQRAVVGVGVCLDQATAHINTDLEFHAQSGLNKTVLCAKLGNQNESLRDCYAIVSRQTMVPVTLIERYLKWLNPRFPLLTDQQKAQERICSSVF